jgi:hypothetical protein
MPVPVQYLETCHRVARYASIRVYFVLENGDFATVWLEAML